jgi:hypothetical protein
VPVCLCWWVQRIVCQSFSDGFGLLTPSTSNGARASGSGVPQSSSLSTVLFEDLCEELRNAYPSDLRTKGAKFLVFRLLDNLVDFNWQARDALKDWSDTIEASIHRMPRKDHLRHVYFLQKASELSLYDVNLALLSEIVNALGDAPAKTFTQDDSAATPAGNGSSSRLNRSSSANNAPKTGFFSQEIIYFKKTQGSARLQEYYSPSRALRRR